MQCLWDHQTPDGYWWYTLEANESIAAEMIFLLHILQRPEPDIQQGLIRRILSKQRQDGSWALYHDGPGDISTTLECYLACRLGGLAARESALLRARAFLAHRGLRELRVFSRIHLAMLGLWSWDDCPAMPLELMLLPSRLPFSPYTFSSWARACIVPLLVIMHERPVWPVEIPLWEELGGRPLRKIPSAATALGRLFSGADRLLCATRPLLAVGPLRRIAHARARVWVREHIGATEDIFPALAYALLAELSLGERADRRTIAKAMQALARFRHSYVDDLPPLPYTTGSRDKGQGARERAKASKTDPKTASEAWRYHASRVREGDPIVHQQCCISPVWDTPWAMVSLRAAGAPADDPRLQRAARWLIGQQITRPGDWRVANPRGEPGGWAFEFENPDFPDVDDTIQVLMALSATDVPEPAKRQAMRRGLAWCQSMQSDNGGWGAFDRNNTQSLVNVIPFADHGACLDPPTPDVTGRMLECFARCDHRPAPGVVERAIAFLERTQESDGSWRGRWGVHYLYGTWCVLRGLAAIGREPRDPMLRRGADWIASVQLPDGGFGEGVEGYRAGRYVPLPHGVPSQTAWALMALLAAGRAPDAAAQRAVRFLIARQQPDGAWPEEHYTGTGFPGHFYIRYHGYRHYYPLLALAEYRRANRP
ncbi:MAG: squalene--hopene cyclase [Deltaproteobacteria bacterium]|nr:squalene--hopene cyclase [Deltaproteobacteria bacterium]